MKSLKNICHLGQLTTKQIFSGTIDFEKHFTGTWTRKGWETLPYTMVYSLFCTWVKISESIRIVKHTEVVMVTILVQIPRRQCNYIGFSQTKVISMKSNSSKRILKTHVAVSLIVMNVLMFVERETGTHLNVYWGLPELIFSQGPLKFKA